MIAGILEPTEGKVTFDNLNYKDNEIEIKKNIAYLSGNTKLYDTLSTYELLKMCAFIYDVPKDKIEDRIKEISKILNIDSFLYNKIANLSTGQTQRVNIARCLIHDPKYYILDEATTGLDIISSQIILDFIKQEKNALIIEKDNINDIVLKVEKILNSKELKKSLVKNGVEESAQFSWTTTINRVEEYYQEIANYVIE